MPTAGSWQPGEQTQDGVRGAGGRPATTFPRRRVRVRGEANEFWKQELLERQNQPLPSAEMTQHEAAAVRARPEQNHSGSL